MASLKRVIRASRVQREPKIDTSTDGVLELSVTVGYLAADVQKEEMNKLKLLMLDHCVARVVALERGDLEQHLHLQMVCQARTKSARLFGILVRKYMDWFGVQNISPAGKVTCKVLTNRLLHTWKGMIGYCLKDSALTHFEVEMLNISDQDVVAGKTLHSIYGRADLKSRVVLTNKNIGERCYVWFKYKEHRHLTATMLSTLTDMVNSAMCIPSASSVIPVSGLGMEQHRMNAFWKFLVDPTNVDKADIADVFIRKREYVRGRYHDEADLQSPGDTTDTGMVYEQVATTNTSTAAPLGAVKGEQTQDHGEVPDWDGSIAKKLAERIYIELSSDSDDDKDIPSKLVKDIDVIVLSSDSDSDGDGEWPCDAASAVEDREPATYFFEKNVVRHKVVNPDALFAHINSK